MKLRQAVLFVQVLILATIATLSFTVTSVWAAENQSNQDMNQPAMLIAPDPEFQINVYPMPATDKQRIGYGLGGESVTVIEQAGSNQGYLWNYVKFDKSPQLTGWIREEFVEIQKNADQQNFDQQSSPSTQNNGWNRRQTNDRQNQLYKDMPQNSNWTNRYSSTNQRQNYHNR